MSRFTISDLRSQIHSYNEFLADSGSNFYFEERATGGYQGVLLRTIGEDGKKTNFCENVEVGSSRECYETMIRKYQSIHGELHYKDKRTRAMAKGVLKSSLDFTKDVVQLRQSELVLLAQWAKWTRYRKPQGSSRSLGAAFYLHLQKRVKI